MRIIGLLFIIIFISIFSLHADEIEYDYSKVRGISVGGAGYFEISKAGGFGEFGYTVYYKNRFDIRNYFRLGGGASEKNALFFTLTTRYAFGSIKPVTKDFALRRYAVIDVSFSCFKKGSKSFFVEPYVINLRVGSGMEFIVLRGSYFIEMVFGYSFITKGSMKDALDMSNIGGAIVLGGRGYF